MALVAAAASEGGIERVQCLIEATVNVKRTGLTRHTGTCSWQQRLEVIVHAPKSY